MPAIVAARFNPDLKAKYEHLIRPGKAAKFAFTALCESSSSWRMHCCETTENGRRTDLDQNGYSKTLGRKSTASIGPPALQAWIAGAVVNLLGVTLARRRGDLKTLPGFDRVWANQPGAPAHGPGQPELRGNPRARLTSSSAPSAVTPDDERAAAIGVANGRIGAIAGHRAPLSARTTIGNGAEVATLPGRVGSHVHICEPGHTDRKGSLTATRGAAGGSLRWSTCRSTAYQPP